MVSTGSVDDPDEGDSNLANLGSARTMAFRVAAEILIEQAGILLARRRVLD